MKKKLFYTGLSLFVLIQISCDNKTKNEQAAPKDSVSIKVNYTDSIDWYETKLNDELSGAAVPQTYIVSKLIHFSSETAYDTLLLVISAGPVRSSLSKFMIRSPKGEILYEKAFHTIFFARNITIPNTPENSTSEERDRYNLLYLKSLNKEKIEKFVHDSITRFLDNTPANKKDLAQIPEDDDGITNKNDFKEALTNIGLTAIWLPNFDGDEGVEYLAFSPKKHKTVSILTSD